MNSIQLSQYHVNKLQPDQLTFDIQPMKEDDCNVNSQYLIRISSSPLQFQTVSFIIKNNSETAAVMLNIQLHPFQELGNGIRNDEIKGDKFIWNGSLETSVHVCFLKSYCSLIIN